MTVCWTDIWSNLTVYTHKLLPEVCVLNLYDLGDMTWKIKQPAEDAQLWQYHGLWKGQGGGVQPFCTSHDI